MTEPAPASSRGSLSCAAFAAAFGVFYILLGLRLLPVSDSAAHDNDPHWLVLCVGLAFLLAGVAIAIQTFGHANAAGELPEAAPRSFVWSCRTGRGWASGVVTMNPFRAFVRAVGLAVLIAPLIALSSAGMAAAQAPSGTEKLNAYVGCVNRLSERAYDSRKRYFSWVGKNGPTGKERIIYGTYTIYGTSGCKKHVQKANELQPRDDALRAP